MAVEESRSNQAYGMLDLQSEPGSLNPIAAETSMIKQTDGSPNIYPVIEYLISVELDRKEAPAMCHETILRQICQYE